MHATSIWRLMLEVGERSAFASLAEFMRYFDARHALVGTVVDPTT
jgi:hypothetical protein